MSSYLAGSSTLTTSLNYWTKSGSDLSYTGGNVGIGTTTPNNLLSVYDLIDFNNTDFNTKLGYQAGKYIVSGAIQNTFIGYQAGHATSSTSAVDYNTGVGYRALYNLKSGSLNSAFGTESQLNTTSGTANTSMGYQSLMTNTTGFSNVAIGRGALKSNLGGISNTALGTNAGLANTDGYDNTYVGNGAAQSGTSAYDMVCIGRTSCQANSTGASSVVIGRSAGASFTGSNNVMIGYYAGAYETGSDSFYVNNTDLTDTNSDKSNSLLYGKFGGGSPTSATLNINASTTIKLQATVSASNSGTTLTTTQNSPNISILNTNTTNNNYASLDFKQYNSSASTITTSKIAGVQTVHTAGSEAGNLSFLTASAGALSEKMVILANGNVGVGTTTPNWKLQVAGATPSIALSDTSAGANLKHWFIQSSGGSLNIGTSSDSFVGATVPAITVLGGSGATSGNIGFNNTNPAYGLEVNGKLTGAVVDNVIRANSSASYNTIAVNNTRVSGSGQASMLFSRNGTTDFNFGVNFANLTTTSGHDFFIYDPTTAKNLLYISPTNDIRLGYLTTGSGGYFGTQALTLKSSTGLLGLGITSPTAMLHISTTTPGVANLFTATAGANSVVIDKDGELGIGTTGPTQKLEVNGGIRQNTATAKPTCDSTVRGTTWFFQGGAGVKDTYEVCAKDAADAYAWRTIY